MCSIIIIYESLHVVDVPEFLWKFEKDFDKLTFLKKSSKSFFDSWNKIFIPFFASSLETEFFNPQVREVDKFDRKSSQITDSKEIFDFAKMLVAEKRIY